MPPRIDATRSHAVIWVAGVIVLLMFLSSCGSEAFRALPVVGRYADGRLTARPHEPTMSPLPAGRHEVSIEGHRALLFVPSSYRPDRPAPFALLLHGASGKAEGAFRIFAPFAERAGMVLLAPQSTQGGAWDVMVLGFGPDVEMIDAELEWVFHRFAVDPSHLAVAGFSNGGTYTLSLGLTNGELFSHVIALSPGGMTRGAPQGRPSVFVAHGTDDQVLPIDQASRVIVPQLRSEGYRVRYVEFQGGHHLERPISRQALTWFLRP